MLFLCLVQQLLLELSKVQHIHPLHPSPSVIAACWSESKMGTSVLVSEHIHFCFFHYLFCFQCFDAVGWAAGRESGLQKLSGGALAWLSV